MSKKVFAVIAGLAALSIFLKASAIIDNCKECNADDSSDCAAEG